MKQFYAYVHARPNGSVFYVGKGTGRRAYLMAGRNEHHQRTVRKYGKENILIGRIDCSSEAIAKDLEVGLIKCFRRMAARLVNRTDGGDGTFGYVPSDEVRMKLKQADKSYMKTQAYKQALSDSLVGRHLSQDHVAKLSIATKRRYSNPVARTAHSEIMKAALSAPEAKSNLSAGQVGRRHSLATRAKMSLAAKKRWLENPVVVTEEMRKRLSMAKKGKPLTDAQYAAVKKHPVIRSDGERFESVVNAAKAIGVNPNSVHRVLRGKRNTVHGYSFVYAAPPAILTIKQQHEASK